MAGRRGRGVYGSPRWQRVRREVLERAGWRCEGCGKLAGRFEIHHATPIHKGGAAFDPGNLEALCLGCHADRHRPVMFADRPDWSRLVFELVNP